MRFFPGNLQAWRRASQQFFKGEITADDLQRATESYRGTHHAGCSLSDLSRAGSEAPSGDVEELAAAPGLAHPEVNTSVLLLLRRSAAGGCAAPHAAGGLLNFNTAAQQDAHGSSSHAGRFSATILCTPRRRSRSTIAMERVTQLRRRTLMGCRSGGSRRCCSACRDAASRMLPRYGWRPCDMTPTMQVDWPAV
jgi:hypothetical protein